MSAVIRLKTLDWLAEQKPSKPRKPRRQPEFELQCAIAYYLDMALTSATRWCHIPNGEYRRPKTSARLQKMGVKAGVPDIMLLHGGRAYFFEIKAGRGKATESQVDWMAWLNRHDYQACVVRSVADLDAILKVAGIPLKGTLQ